VRHGRLYLLLLLLANLLLGGCASTFETSQRPLAPDESDETLSWWRLPDQSGDYEPKSVAAVVEEDAYVRPPAKFLLERLQRGFAIDDINTVRVRARERWYAERPLLVQNIFERSGPYLYYILDELERAGLPSEIALIPFIESGFDPAATSSAQAAGLWQFIPSTALKYRLRVDDNRDDRRDVRASTTAAIGYFRFLYGMFGDWHLAFASYNWGENAVSRVVEKNRVKGRSIRYEHLELPEETKDYVPKLQAIKNILLNPEAYHIKLPELPNQPYFSTIDQSPVELHFGDAAKFAGIPVRDFQNLNMAYLNGIVPRRAPVVLPADKVEQFQLRIAEYGRKHPARGRP
jgi:membrane-bound lytic murein transglycosylase D